MGKCDCVKAGLVLEITMPTSIQSHLLGVA